MNKEELEKLMCDVNDLIAIFENNMPVTNEGFDIEKIKTTVSQMAEKSIENAEERKEFLSWMENHEFYTSPASTRFHGNFDGGLCVHSIQVAYQALKFTGAFFIDFMKTVHAEKYNFTAGDIFVAAIAHDFCKAVFYSTSFRNTKDIFGNWKKTPYFTVKDGNRNLGHGNESVLLLLETMPSYLKKRHVLEAISRHMGFSDVTDTEMMNYSNFLENPLVLLIQMADQTASGWYNY